jgi:hypothetical protein
MKKFTAAQRKKFAEFVTGRGLPAGWIPTPGCQHAVAAVIDPKVPFETIEKVTCSLVGKMLGGSPHLINERGISATALALIVVSAAEHHDGDTLSHETWHEVIDAVQAAYLDPQPPLEWIVAEKYDVAALRREVDAEVQHRRSGDMKPKSLDVYYRELVANVGVKDAQKFLKTVLG